MSPPGFYLFLCIVSSDHIALAVSLALAGLAVPLAEEHEFVTAFLTHWGEALDRAPRRPRKCR